MVMYPKYLINLNLNLKGKSFRRQPETKEKVQRPMKLATAIFVKEKQLPREAIKPRGGWGGGGGVPNKA